MKFSATSRWIFGVEIVTQGHEVYRGRKGWLDEPIATIHGNEVYRCRKGLIDEPIATVEAGGRMSAAAAVYLLLM
jgi:hypothetical protein